MIKVTSWGCPGEGGPDEEYPETWIPTDSGYVAIYSTTKAHAAIKSDGFISTWGATGDGGVDGPTDGGYVLLRSVEDGFTAIKAGVEFCCRQQFLLVISACSERDQVLLLHHEFTSNRTAGVVARLIRC